MSSLAAAQADGYYLPPDRQEKLKSQTNQWQKSGVVRMELPFDGWCLVCNQHVARGLRFNATKKAAGKYLSTTLFKFTFKCLACKAELEMTTDPQNRSYSYSGNLRRQVQDYEPEDGDGVVVLDQIYGPNGGEEGVEDDAISRMQREKDEADKVEAVRQRVVSLEARSQLALDDYGVNAALRSAHRGNRHADKARLVQGRLRGMPDHVPLADVSPSDTREARRVFHNKSKGGERVPWSNGSRRGGGEGGRSRGARVGTSISLSSNTNSSSSSAAAVEEARLIEVYSSHVLPHASSALSAVAAASPGRYWRRGAKGNKDKDSGSSSSANKAARSGAKKRCLRRPIAGVDTATAVGTGLPVSGAGAAGCTPSVAPVSSALTHTTTASPSVGTSTDSSVCRESRKVPSVGCVWLGNGLGLSSLASYDSD
jgi:hypothetical protein